MSLSDSLLDRCQEVLQYTFRDTSLLALSLTHASVADNRLASNERLEFLGDAVLAIIVIEALYERFPDYLEGELTKIKSMIVSRRTCARLAEESGLPEFLLLGKGIISQNKVPMSCNAAVLESVIGAIYIDGGKEAAEAFVLRLIEPLIENADAKKHHGNYKSMLQQYAQRSMDTTPVYEVLDEKGPDHSKCFEVSVVIGQQRFGSAWGNSKKEAEQSAAKQALQELQALPSERLAVS